MSNRSIILARGEVSIEAAADPQRPPQVSIVAYSGGTMNPAGWGSVIIDLAGADVSGDVPLLAGHAEDLHSIVGQGRAEVRDSQIFCPRQPHERDRGRPESLGLVP